MHRMLADGATPNTKTFTALIGSVGKMGAVQQALDIVSELLAADSPSSAPSTYSALLAACEKGGLWDLAISLFEKMCPAGPPPPTFACACDCRRSSPIETCRCKPQLCMCRNHRHTGIFCLP